MIDDMGEYRLYVIELSDEAKSKFRTEATCLYVGQSWHPPEVRFKQHLDGIRASRHVKNFGLRLRPDLYSGLPTFADQKQASRGERRLGNQLENRGFFVVGPNYRPKAKARKAAARAAKRSPKAR